MAVLHRKEEKIQAVLGRLPKKYSGDDFVAMFIKLYSKDWGKIKSAYIKASQDKEPGTVIHMPKPDLYLKQILEIFLTQKPETPIEVPEEAVAEDKLVSAKAVKSKVPTKAAESKPIEPKIVKSKVAVKKAEPEKATLEKKPKVAVVKEPAIKTTKAKAAPKGTVVEDPVEVVKKVRVIKKKVD